MTEKRFTLTFDDKIVDNLTGIIHNVHSGYDVAMDFSGLLNTLNDENEQLKTRIQLLSPLLDIADAIIDLSDDEKAKAFWEKKNEEIEQEWKKILDGDVE